MKTISPRYDFLLDYLQTHSPVSHEATGQQKWLDYIKPYVDTCFTDTYGTTVGVINPDAPYKVVIEAHADEISWLVNYITKEGYIYVVRNGGSDYQIAPSMQATLHTDEGPIPAVFGWPAVHVRSNKKEPVPAQDTIVLDCGCATAKEVADKDIHVGTVVTFNHVPTVLNEQFIVSRALDNKAGGFMIAEVARLLHENKQQLPFCLYIVNAVQEEIGLRGAQMIAQQLKPHVAIVTDVTHDTQSPHYNKIKQGDIACGKGPVIDHAPAVQRNLQRMLNEVANTHKVPFQHGASSGSTGTDTDAFAYAGTGTAAALLSVPLKYMHTTVEMVHKRDIAHTIELFYHFLTQLKAGHDFRYFVP